MTTPETPFEPVWSIGLMTGTVLDGNIDVALMKTDGVGIVEQAGFSLIPYEPLVIDLLNTALRSALDWQFDGPEPAVFAKAERIITQAQSNAIISLLDSTPLSIADIGVVGFHGQTVLHRPAERGQVGRTRQLGDGQLMANRLAVPVAYDFRTADVNAGGQGAPLAAIYHTALLKELNDDSNTAILNLGGVANVTWWDGADNLIAFDTGPANAPLNDFVKHCGLGEMDKDGQLAANGMVDERRLESLLAHPYLRQAYPKSLDRFDFSSDMAKGLSPENGAALLTAFSAAAVGRALDLLPSRPSRLIVCGGGRRNPSLMQAISSRANVAAVPAEDVGWRGDATEAECFAFLAVRSLRGLPISFPSTTGVPSPMTGGTLAWPALA